MSTSRITRWAVALGLAVASPALQACHDDPSGGAEPKTPEVMLHVVPEQEQLELRTEETVQLRATVVDESGNPLARGLSWSSETPDLATVTPAGLLTAKAAGEARIIATVQGQDVFNGHKSCGKGEDHGHAHVAVRVLLRVGSVQLDQDRVQLRIQERLHLDCHVFCPAGTPLERAIAWSSSDPSVAAVDEQGNVVGVALGEALVVAESEGKSDTTIVSVVATPASLEIEPAQVRLRLDETLQLRARVRDRDGSPMEGQVHWYSMDEGIATVGADGLLRAVAPGRTAVKATMENVEGSVPVEVLAPVATVEISPERQTLQPGATYPLKAIVRDAAGNALTGREVTWYSFQAAVVSVDANGLLTAHRVGEAEISAKVEGVRGLAKIRVAEAVGSIRVEPAELVLYEGLSVKLEAITMDAAGNPLPTPVTWSSSDPAVATVAADGTVAAVAAGVAVITATSGDVSGTAAVTVRSPTTAVASVLLTPAQADLVEGDELQLTAVPRDASGQALTGRFVTFSSSDPSVASVSQTGIVRALKPGTSVLAATSEGKSGTAALRVHPRGTLSIEVAPASLTLREGQSAQLTAVLKDASGTPVPGAAFAWSSGDPAVAVVSDGGVVTAIKAGSAEIRAAAGSLSGSVAVTVKRRAESLAVEPAAATLREGETVHLEAVLVNDEGTEVTGIQIAWLSSDAAVAMVSADGLVAAVKAGSATITASGAGLSGDAAITVVAPVASVTVDPASAIVRIGETVLLAATPKDGAGNVLDRPVAWSSGNEAIATVEDGLVTALAAGQTTITATSEDESGSAALTVRHGVGSIRFKNPDNVSLGVGRTLQLEVQVFYIGGGEIHGPVDIAFRSGDEGVATVDDDGLLLGVNPGSVTITAEAEGVEATVNVLVTTDVVDRVEIVDPRDEPDRPLVVGQTMDFDARTFAADGTELFGRQIVWSSSDEAVATIDAEGVATGVAIGSVTFAATSEGKSASVTLNVVGPHGGGGGDGGGGGGGGGGGEGVGSNLSVPVIFAEGVGLTGQPVTTETGLRPGATETIIGTPAADGSATFWDAGNVADCPVGAPVYYCQHGPNTWRAEWQDGSAGAPVPAQLDWGDNLESHTFNTHTPLRIEVALYGPSTLSGFNMPYVLGSGVDEMRGTDGTTAAMLPTVYSSTPRLVIEKLDNDTYDPTTGTGSVIHEVFSGAVFEAYGNDGPGYYRAEVNVAGKVIYGYQLDIRNAAFPGDAHKYGWYRLTFLLDGSGPHAPNVVVAGLLGSEEGEAPLYQARYAADRSWIDIWVDSASGGGGGGHTPE